MNTREPTSRRRALAAMAGLGAAGMASLRGAPAYAQAWPARPIRFVVAQPPGASTDGTARTFGEYFSSRLGVPVVIENKPGAAGMIAAEIVARAPPDGYTFLVTLHSQLAQAPVLLKKAQVDPDRELTPIGKIGPGRVVVVGRKTLPAKDFREVVEMTKVRPVSAGNYSIGSGWQLQLAEVMKRTKADFSVVQYRGTGAMLGDVVGGQIDIGAGSFAGFGQLIDRGDVRALMIAFGGGRTPRYPELGTWADNGFEGEAFTQLEEANMLLGPAGLPTAIRDRLAGLFVEAVKESARVQALRQTLVADDPPLVGSELDAFIQQTWPVYRRLSTELGLAGTL